jgi:hypothetical protein
MGRFQEQFRFDEDCWLTEHTLGESCGCEVWMLPIAAPIYGSSRTSLRLSLLVCGVSYIMHKEELRT